MELDRLEVILEANYSGLTSSLKQGMNQIMQFVQSANGQAIDWKKILGSTVTPALMATIASTFALAVTQALQFQSSVQAASLNTATSFANTSASMQDGAYGISSATGQSANDVETAIGQVSMVYKNYNDALTVTNDLAEFATTEHLSMADALSMMLPLLQSWGVSASDAGNVMAALGESTAMGKIPIDQLAASLQKAGTSLSGLTTLPAAIADLQSLSNAPGSTPTGILNNFDVIVSGANKTNLAVNGIFGDMSKAITSGPNGLLTAFDLIASKMQELGQTKATALASSVGISVDGISTDLKIPLGDFQNLEDGATKFLENLKPLEQWFHDNQTLLDKFKEAWMTLVADLGTKVGPGILQGLLDLLNGADTLMKIFNEGTSGPTAQSVQSGILAQGSDDVRDVMQGKSGALGSLIVDSIKEGFASLFNLGGSSPVTNYNINLPSNSAATQTLQKGSNQAASSSQLPIAQ